MLDLTQGGRAVPTVQCLSPSSSNKQPVRPKLLAMLGPGLIAGASDDDPSGIATYSLPGAQFVYALGWFTTVVMTLAAVGMFVTLGH